MFKEKPPKLLLVIIFIALAIPITLYLVYQNQNLEKQAAAGQATVNLVPTQVNRAAGEEFQVEVFLNTAEKVSAATIVLQPGSNSTGSLNPIRVNAEIGDNKPFTEIVRTTTNSFSVVSRRAAANLPTGNIKVATLTLSFENQGQGTIEINPNTTQVSVYKATGEDVLLSIIKGTSVAYTIAPDNYCRISACPNVSLDYEARTDGKYNVNLTWTAASSEATAYKIYRNLTNSVPNTHPGSNLVTTVNTTTFKDTNNSAGFEPGVKIYYDVDAYKTCPQ